MYGEQEIVYVVQEEPSMSQDDADKLALYSNILGGYFQNKGKSAAQLQADIDYLKKKYPNEKYEKLWLPYPQNYLIKDQRYNYKDENMFVPDESYGGLLMLNAIVVRKK